MNFEKRKSLKVATIVASLLFVASCGVGSVETAQVDEGVDSSSLKQSGTQVSKGSCGKTDTNKGCFKRWDGVGGYICACEGQRIKDVVTGNWGKCTTVVTNGSSNCYAIF